MTDNFLHVRNELDRTLARVRAPADACQYVVEGLVRRMINVEGPTATAVRLQRLVDICAVADMKPLDHWWQPQRRSVRFLKQLRRYFWSVMAGFGLAILIGDILRLLQP